LITLTNAQKQRFIDEGYLVVPGLLPPELVAGTKARLLGSLGIVESDPSTWTAKPSYPTDLQVIATTDAARTPEFEAVTEQLVGADFRRGACFSPFLEWNHLPADLSGFIPVLTYPTPGGPRLEPGGFHIDGGRYVTTYPGRNYLAVMAYLTDVAEYGGATVVRPGSHRQVFERWAADGHEPEEPFAVIPELDFATPVPVTAEAGDVCFMHYLMVHSGSKNYAGTIRVGMNTAVQPDPERPYRRKHGPPQPDWTPLDYTLRMDEPA
jgi:hypothetical protein